MQNLFQSYRDTKGLTFYFVNDKDRPADDPLHKVVVGVFPDGRFLLTDANNTTGNINEFGQDASAYMKYLKDQGVDISLFKSIPKSEEELKEQKLLGKENKDLDWFKKLSFDYKSKYIGRGHILTDKQFDYLWDHKVEDLLNKYVNTGQKLPDNQLDKILSKKQFKDSYLRARLIVWEQIPLNYKEFNALSNNVKHKVENNIRTLTPNKMIGKASELGHIGLVNEAINKGANDFNWALDSAALNGHMDIVKLLLPKADDFSDALHSAKNDEIKEVIKDYMRKNNIV